MLIAISPLGIFFGQSINQSIRAQGRMSKPVVLMPVQIFQELESSLEERFNLVRLWEQPGQLEIQRQQIRALVVSPLFHVNREFLSSLPALEIVCTYSVGLDKVDLAACKERGLAVAYTPDAVTEDTADMALALVLATMRRICAADSFVRQGLWPKQGGFPLAHKVSGKRVGIVGLGRIGMAIAKRAEGFGCRISYFSRSKKEVPYTHYSNLIDLAKDSDILIVACSLSPETTHLVNRDVLNALGEEGTLINIARGPIVDESEMVAALKQGRLGAAGLDVFEHEPNVPEELLGMTDKVVLQPHCGTSTWETRRDMSNLIVANLEAHFVGKPLLTPVQHS